MYLPDNTSIIPKAPIIYINDPTKDGLIVSGLNRLIPKTMYLSLMDQQNCSSKWLRGIQEHHARDTVLVFRSKQVDCNEIVTETTATVLRELAIKLGCNFASVNMRFNQDAVATQKRANHLDLLVKGSAEDITYEQGLELAKKIYKWLFTAFTVKDTLHLIPDDQMEQTDSTTVFKDYKYCAIGDCSKVAKDAKVQFVALIVSKPAIISENKVTWQVADKTGVANFYFKYRGPSSQYTWDWVMRLEPGERKSLPRMPCVLVKERLSTSILKAPLRIPGSVVHKTGNAIQCIGTGISGLGKRMKMGRRKRWVAKDDMAEYLAQNKNFRVESSSQEKKEVIQIFTEKGAKAWNDNDSERSTLWDEKISGDDEKKDII